MLLCLRALGLQSWMMPREGSCKMQTLGSRAGSSGILLNPTVVGSDPCGQRHTFAEGRGLQPGSRPPGVPGWDRMPTHVNGKAAPSLFPRSALRLSQACTSCPVSAARAAAGCQGTFQPICMWPCMPFCLLHFGARERQTPALSDHSDGHAGPTGAGGLAAVPWGSPCWGPRLPGPWVLPAAASGPRERAAEGADGL